MMPINNGPTAILIMIPYGSDIGFAIVRLMTAFLAAAERVTGSLDRVHFSFTSLDGHSRAFPPGFDNILKLHPQRPTPDELSQLGRYVREHGIDQVFALDLPVGARVCKTLRSAGVRSVVSYWGAPMSSLQPRWRLTLKQIECFLKRGRSPDWYIFESEAMRDMGVRGRGIRAARTDIVRTGVDSSAFSADSVRTVLPHERFGIPGERLVVVFMGHLHKRKGVHVLIEAMKFIVVGRGRTDLHALILGNRPEEVPQFANLLENSTASGHVTFGGYHEDVPAILAGCDIGCIPSTGWDSYPMSSLEMQASGLPVVVSDLQGVPETVDPEVTGLVVPAGDPEALSDALERLADDPQLRSRMGAAGAARIRRELTVHLQIQRLSHSMARAFSTRPR